jgi:Protein of unknown function (DUF2637)
VSAACAVAVGRGGAQAAQGGEDRAAAGLDGGSGRWVRRATTASVVMLAAIAAVVSFRHMHALTLAHGETAFTAALIPLSVDGMIVASSMTLLADSRAGHAGGLLPWLLLVTGSAASLAANVAVAEPTAYGRAIAAWPSFALIGAYELLMRQIRHTATAAAAAAAPDTPAVVAAPGLAAGTWAGPDPAVPGPKIDSKIVTMTAVGPTSRRRPASPVTGPARPTSAELLAQARRIDATHRRQRGRPASAETLRTSLRIGATAARRLKDQLRASTATRPSTNA